MMLRIRELRQERGLTIAALAERAGVSRSLLNEFELGVKAPNTRRLHAIASALGVAPAELFEKNGGDSDLAELIEGYSRLNPRQRTAVLNLIRSYPEPDSNAE